MRVLLAPDKFKGTVTAAEVAGHLSIGIRRVAPHTEVVIVPVADGGDGTLAAAEASGFAPVSVVASGPTGEPITTRYARRGSDAIIELAAVSGLSLLPGGTPAPLTATSAGTGELIAAAVRDGCTRIVVGLGGSACTDGGAGLAAALGVRIVDADGREVGPGGAALAAAQRIDLSGVSDAVRAATIVIASDVDNPLTGPRGAAATYAPQKGATPDHVLALDAALGRWADLVSAQTGADHRNDPGAGAAGGVGFALAALFNAVSQPGAEVVFGLTGFAGALARTDLVITGEGSLDEQTLQGKAPAAVAAAGRANRKPVIAVAGRLSLTERQWRAAGFTAAYALLDRAPAAQAMAEPGPLLEDIGEQIAREHLPQAR